MSRYYYDNCDLNKNYATLWKGYITYEGNNNIIINLLDIDNILIDICDVNFYIILENNNIYLSLCQDTKYYYYQFERHIKKVINKFEDFFKINFIYAEFYATEVKHVGNQYKYTITNIETKLVLKKKTLNWSVYEKKGDLETDLKKMDINR
jgi:hypothetical protein